MAKVKILIDVRFTIETDVDTDEESKEVDLLSEEIQRLVEHEMGDYGRLNVQLDGLYIIESESA